MTQQGSADEEKVPVNSSTLSIHSAAGHSKKFHSIHTLQYCITQQREEDEATQGGETVTECRKISFQRRVVSKSVTWSHQTSEMKAKNSMLRTRVQI